MTPRELLDRWPDSADDACDWTVEQWAEAKRTVAALERVATAARETFTDDGIDAAERRLYDALAALDAPEADHD